MFQTQRQKGSLPTINLSDFTHENVNEAFTLTQEFKKSKLLDGWLKRSRTIEINEDEKAKLGELQDKLLIYGKAWNVQELRERFIAPLTEMVNFYNFDLKYGSFSHRYIEAVINSTKVRGKIDWIVASGQYQPRQPFLFLNAHTYMNNNGTDPVGQITATLYLAKIIAQTPNKPTLFNPRPRVFANVPLYGVYVIGSLWYFVRLKDQSYYISSAYDATYTEELHNIYRLLKAQKHMISEMVSKN